MFSFLIKKWFFDTWDQFLKLLIFNVGFIFIFFCLVLVRDLMSILGPFPVFLLAAIVIVLAGAYSAFLSSCITQFAWEIGQDFKDIMKKGCSQISSGLLLGLCYALYFLILQVAIPFYGSMQNFIGPLAIGILFWSSVLWLLSSQFYLPVSIQLGGNMRTILKKSLLLFFDNTWFAVGLFLGSIVILLVSVFTAFLFPGIAGLLFWLQTGLKLRCYKYDAQDKSPVDWDLLLKEEREKMGRRTLRNLFFPWKD